MECYVYLFAAYLLDVRTICNELSVVKYKFYQIGIQLGIPHHKLMEFKQADDPMAVAINYWLKGNVEGAVISWESIVAAIQSIHVGESGLAKRMCNKYCQGQNKLRQLVAAFIYFCFMQVHHDTCHVKDQS